MCKNYILYRLYNTEIENNYYLKEFHKIKYVIINLSQGLLVISSSGHGSPSNDLSVNAAPSANDFRQ